MNGAKAPETPSSVLQEKTVTPETLPTVIGADEGYDGLSQVTVNPDSQLKAENIRSGKTIFGVTGAFAGEPVYTTTDLVKYCYENNKNIYGSVSPNGLSVDWTMSYDGLGSVTTSYHSLQGLVGRCAAWQEDNHYTMLNPSPLVGSNYGGGLFGHTAVIKSYRLDGITLGAGTNNLTSSIAQGTPVSVNTSFMIYPFSSQPDNSKKGPAAKNGVKTVTYNGTGTVQYSVNPSSSGSLTMKILFDDPIILENLELTYYCTDDSNIVDLYKGLETRFLTTYVEW